MASGVTVAGARSSSSSMALRARRQVAWSTMADSTSEARGSMPAQPPAGEHDPGDDHDDRAGEVGQQVRVVRP